MRMYLPCLLAAGMLCAACQQTTTPRLNAPPHGLSPQRTAEMRTTFDHMVDNAMLETMSVSDIHFVADRPTLNTLGEQRLKRLAWMLDVYGGQIRFSTDVEDEELLQQRTDSILAYLDRQGVDTTMNVLRRDLPGGRGLDANQAMEIRHGEAMYRPKGGKSGG